MLAGKGAHVVLAVRNLDKGNEAADRIKQTSPTAVVSLQELDLTSLDSVRKAADELRAGLPAHRSADQQRGRDVRAVGETTKDGFEMQFGTNHLGPFALTGLLLDNILPRRGVTCGHGQQRWPPHPGPNPFRRSAVAAQVQPRRGLWAVKLANLLFTYELQRRLNAKVPHQRARRTPRVLATPN